MKPYQVISGLLIATLLAGCTDRQFMGVATGSHLGGMFGSAIGGISGGYRGENMGAAIGMIAGGLLGAAATAEKQPRKDSYDDEEYEYSHNHNYNEERYGYARPPVAEWSDLEVSNIRFIDPNHSSSLESGEHAFVTMEIRNRGNATIYDIAPHITCNDRRIAVSPTAIMSALEPGRGFRYKIEVVGAKRLKDGVATFTIAFGEKKHRHVAGGFRIRTVR